jgi:hypothetical protein
MNESKLAVDEAVRLCQLLENVCTDYKPADFLNPDS